MASTDPPAGSPSANPAGATERAPPASPLGRWFWIVLVLEAALLAAAGGWMLWMSRSWGASSHASAAVLREAGFLSIPLGLFFGAVVSLVLLPRWNASAIARTGVLAVVTIYLVLGIVSALRTTQTLSDRLVAVLASEPLGTVEFDGRVTLLGGVEHYVGVSRPAGDPPTLQPLPPGDDVRPLTVPVADVTTRQTARYGADLSPHLRTWFVATGLLVAIVIVAALAANAVAFLSVRGGDQRVLLKRIGLFLLVAGIGAAGLLVPIYFPQLLVAHA